MPTAISAEERSQKLTLKQLQQIPSIGPAGALDLWHLGIRQVADLAGQNPQHMYQRLNQLSGIVHDVCVLYTLRCAVYFATDPTPDPAKLKWWYWKGKTYNE
ncbi:MAG: helix-hairpin-helix domain-containing protein [Bernardetiaceae bacterium]|jgi:hypothetical protein|nr:helix-hairpin-helix domain-containing protein [Bernardetiaceae bacterium]